MLRGVVIAAALAVALLIGAPSFCAKPTGSVPKREHAPGHSAAEPARTSAAAAGNQGDRVPWTQIEVVVTLFAAVGTWLNLRARRRRKATTAMMQQATSWQSPQVPMQSPVFNAPVTINVGAPQSAAESAGQVPSGEPPPIFQAILDVQADMARGGLLRQRRHILQAAVQSADAVCNVEVRAELRLRLSQAHNDLGEREEADRRAAEAIELLRRGSAGGEGTP